MIRYPTPFDLHETQGWRNRRIRGDAYDRFVDKYYLLYSITDDYRRSLPGLFS